jgi:hypothetical protein
VKIAVVVARAERSIPETDSACPQAGQTIEDFAEPESEKAAVPQDEQPVEGTPALAQIAKDVVISDVPEPTLDEPPPAASKIRDPRGASEEESLPTHEIVEAGDDQELAATRRWNGISRLVMNPPETPKAAGKIRWFISRMNPWRAR